MCLEKKKSHHGKKWILVVEEGGETGEREIEVRLFICSAWCLEAKQLILMCTPT